MINYDTFINQVLLQCNITNNVDLLRSKQEDLSIPLRSVDVAENNYTTWSH